MDWDTSREFEAPYREFIAMLYPRISFVLSLHKFIPELIKLYLDGKFPLDKLVKVYKPEEITLAAEEMKAGKTLKGVIKW